ncbi:MAG: SDR family oxidoreductase [Flavobacteriales bacterium]|nr:SDR family oxidoreductase [Flavobacteriales bacterium]
MKTFVITGAGSGMGRATAILLSQDDDVHLVLAGRKKEPLSETISLCKNPGQHFSAGIDIRGADAWKKLYAEINAPDLNISGLFANAGVGGENHYGPKDWWEEVLSINLTGTYVSIMETLPHLVKSTELWRNIVITSSCLARFGVANYTAYCTTKTGLLGLTRALALELAPDKILVNAICPGWVETEMAKAGIQKLADRENISYEESLSKQASLVPLNKISSPDEVATLVKFLLTNQQTSITGQGIDINNGSFMI